MPRHIFDVQVHEPFSGFFLRDLIVGLNLSYYSKEALLYCLL